MLTDEQVERYSRHILLKEVGVSGQTKLLNSKVLIVGAGGLGSPCAYYLAAAGVGTIGIMDGDVVDLSNLQRQILHRTSDIGRPKPISAKEKLMSLNPDINVILYTERLTSQNALDVIKDYDVVVDGSDNFAARYLINDACVILKKPFVHGSVLRFEGQLSVFIPGEGPCYRCVYPSPPPPGVTPSCQEAGVLGVVPGLIGTLEAVEVLKLLLRVGEPFCGKLLLCNTLTAEFIPVSVRRNPKCPACGDMPTITSLVDYDDFCGLTASREVDL